MSTGKVRPREFVFRTSLQWDSEKRGVLSAEGKPDIEVATPPEFKGHEGIWSPEDLQVAALDSCILLTFLYLAGREGLELVSYESEAEGTLESSPEGMQFTSFTVRPRIVVAPGEDVEAADRAVRKAAESCLVHRSLKPEVSLEPEVHEAGA